MPRARFASSRTILPFEGDRLSIDHDVVDSFSSSLSPSWVTAVCVCNITTIIIKWNLFNCHLSLHWLPSRASRLFDETFFPFRFGVVNP